MRSYAAARGVRLIGDLPIYVAPNRADHRSRIPSCSCAMSSRGAPPDALSATGQLWGNPLYDWPALQRQGYRWWIERLRRRSSSSTWCASTTSAASSPTGRCREDLKTAKAGRWRRGPGATLFRAAEQALGPLPLVVEDLGIITPAVTRLRDELGLPGMVVLQFAFGGGPRNPHRPENHRRNLVVYTGTHDTDTAIGWWESLTGQARAATGLDPAEPNWSLIRMALGSPASVAIVPAQDVLGLGSEARMNRPGTTGRHNWTWRLEPGQLTDELAARLRQETAAARRLAKR